MHLLDLYRLELSPKDTSLSCRHPIAGHLYMSRKCQIISEPSCKISIAFRLQAGQSGF